MDFTSRARSSFTVDGSAATPADWTGGALSRTRLTKTFTGELTGSSVVEAVMLKIDGSGGSGGSDGSGAGDGPAAYVGVERFAGTVHGREGTFLLLHAATALGEDSTGAWTVVPGSGGGGLTGLRGRGEILPDHAFVLDYDLG